MAVQMAKDSSESPGGRDTSAICNQVESDDGSESNGFVSDDSTHDLENDEYCEDDGQDQVQVCAEEDYAEDENSCSSKSETLSGTKSSQRAIPTFNETLKFRRYLDSATSMVFHGKTGLPLTSSPAPLRKGLDRFDFDSSLVSPARIKSAINKCRYPPR